MCLRKLYRNRYRHRTGYKVVLVMNGEYCTGLTSKAHMVTLPLNKWVASPPGVVESPTLGTYKGGFHILTSLSAARRILAAEMELKPARAQTSAPFSRYAIIKVRLRKQVAFGVVDWWFCDREDFSTNTVVARNIMALEEMDV